MCTPMGMYECVSVTTSMSCSDASKRAYSLEASLSLSLFRDMERAYNELMQTEREAITARGHQPEVRAYGRTSLHLPSPTTPRTIEAFCAVMENRWQLHMCRFFLLFCRVTDGGGRPGCSPPRRTCATDHTCLIKSMTVRVCCRCVRVCL